MPENGVRHLLDTFAKKVQTQVVNPIAAKVEQTQLAISAIPSEIQQTHLRRELIVLRVEEAHDEWVTSKGKGHAQAVSALQDYTRLRTMLEENWNYLYHGHHPISILKRVELEGETAKLKEHVLVAMERLGSLGFDLPLVAKWVEDAMRFQLRRNFLDIS